MLQSIAMSERVRIRPPVIRGELMMPVINKDNKDSQYGLVFSGNPNRKSKLIPRDAFWIREGKLYPDSEEPVICATDDALVSVFMALAPRRRIAPGRNAPFGYRGNEDGGTNYYLHASIREEFTTATGFVAVVESAEFKLVELETPKDWPGGAVQRLPEYRTTQQVIPLFSVAVHYRDFEALLDEQPNSQVLPYP
jgi:hypothetical protein